MSQVGSLDDHQDPHPVWCFRLRGSAICKILISIILYAANHYKCHSIELLGVDEVRSHKLYKHTKQPVPCQYQNN